MDSNNAGQAVFEMNVLENKLKQLDQQLGIIEQYIIDSDKMTELLDDFSKSGKSEVFVPLGTGVYTKAALDKTDKVLMSIGAGVVAEKDIASAEKLVEKRKRKFMEAREELANQVQMVLRSVSELDQKIKSQGHGDNEGHDHHQ